MATMKLYDISKVFEGISADKLWVTQMALPSDSEAEFVPARHGSYVFDGEALNQVLLYLQNPMSDCLLLTGPSGCGKTSVVLEAAGRLNWAVQQVTLSGKTEVADLIGHPVLVDGKVRFAYGPLVKAMLGGQIIILNEIDTMTPTDLTSLNDVLDGKPLTIVQNNGEVIKAAPGFRVIATANTKGHGDESGHYTGTRNQNSAFLDRFRVVEVGYPGKSALQKIVAKAFPKLDRRGAGLTKSLARLAYEIITVADKEDTQISAPFTIRGLLRIAGLLNQSDKIDLKQAVTIGYASKLTGDEAEYVLRLTRDVFGYKDATAPEADETAAAS